MIRLHPDTTPLQMTGKTPKDKMSAPQQKEKILVIKLSALGDFVQALGAMAAIRRHHPDADITLMTTAPFVSFGRACGYFDHIWEHVRPKFPQLSAWLQLRKALNESGFSRVYDLQNNDRTALYFKLFSKKNRPEWVGTAKDASHSKDVPSRKEGHGFDRLVKTLSVIGINDVKIDDLAWVATNNLADQALIPKDPYVLIVPGCAPQHPYKRWPIENYTHLARILYGWGFIPVIIGTDQEKPLAQNICTHVPEALDYTGKTSFFDIALLARFAAAAIGNDTGPLHIIAPTGCPSWILFSGHSDPQRHAPRGTQAKTIQKQDLTALSLDEVLESVKARAFRMKGKKPE